MARPHGETAELLAPAPRRPKRLAAVVVSTLVDRIVSGAFPRARRCPPSPRCARRSTSAAPPYARR
ncbi:hypothetical protein [Thermocatellispora tengchongensis]|uniref:hypothetical protein n=1 Tax=Thermocatellispora tengchongensis TaxID=1073253 RepID=UPI00363766DF